MVTSVSRQVDTSKVGFSVFDRISYSDRLLPFGNILSARRLRDIFAEEDGFFGYGEHDLWNTGLTLWSFIGQILQDGKQRSCNAAVTHAARYMLEQGLQPPGADSGDNNRSRKSLDFLTPNEIFYKRKKLTG